MRPPRTGREYRVPKPSLRFFGITFSLIWIVSGGDICRVSQSMRNPNLSLLLAAFQGAAICLFPFLAKAQFLPTEVGTTVRAALFYFLMALTEKTEAVRQINFLRRRSRMNQFHIGCCD
jgi:hypothetical protein